MLLLTFDELVARARIGSPKEIQETPTDVKYLAFFPTAGPVIYVEATVPNFVESLTKLQVVQQTALMHALAKMLHSHGDSIMITHDEGGKNRRARVVRIRGVCEQANEIHLLIAR